jgi:hypothetical protein
MSAQTIRILVAGALFAHGIGHTLGFWKPAQSLPLVKLSERQIRLIGGMIWAPVGAGFIVSALGFFGIIVPASWWRPAALIFAVISLIGLLIFGRSWPIFNFIGASAMNIAVLVALLWLDWPPFEMFGR